MLRQPIAELRRWASTIPSVPGLNLIAPAANRIPSSEDLLRFRHAQDLALRGAKEIASFLEPGWSEKRAADLYATWFLDHGVSSFFHHPFCWFGERTRFDGVKNYYDYLPSKRVLQHGDAYILDAAPIVDGYICDIGYSGSMGENQDVAALQEHLADLRQVIPEMFYGQMTGGEIWKKIDALITQQGYDNIHSLYPFSVLGHRVHKTTVAKGRLKFIHFGWQSYWEFISRGIFGQLLNADFQGELIGLWAIEPHLGTETCGAKFEEILVVTNEKAQWLADMQL